MTDEEGREPENETDGARWRLIYLAVLVFTVLVISALWLFSRAFSS